MELRLDAEEVAAAFSDRQRPDVVTDLAEDPLDCDYEDANWFSGREWRDISLMEWEERASGLAFLSPEAFAYFLPGLMSVALRQAAPDLCAVERLEFWLGSEAPSESLKRFVEARFGILRASELDVVARFMTWLAEAKNETRSKWLACATATLERLKQRVAHG